MHDKNNIINHEKCCTSRTKSTILYSLNISVGMYHSSGGSGRTFGVANGPGRVGMYMLKPDNSNLHPMWVNPTWPTKPTEDEKRKEGGSKLQKKWRKTNLWDDCSSRLLLHLITAAYFLVFFFSPLLFLFHFFSFPPVFLTFSLPQNPFNGAVGPWRCNFNVWTVSHAAPTKFRSDRRWSISYY